MRVGIGFDIHRLVEGRSLLLGGVKIPSTKGLLGHSDGDVLLHALCDALLGAVGGGDIGTFFPDSDPKWRNAPSRLFVTRALQQVSKRRCRISNVDLVVLAESPRLSAHRQAIQGSVARTLGLDPSRVNLKAKTMEGLGPIGAKKAIGAYAVVLVEEGGERKKR